MTRTTPLRPVVIALLTALSATGRAAPASEEQRTRAPLAALRTAGPAEGAAATADLLRAHVQARFDADLAAMQVFRPGYAFWQHVFTIPDGAIAYGSAVDGRLLAIFPSAGDWARTATWKDPALSRILAGARLPPRLADRRDLVAQLFEPSVGPVLHNPTRGRFVLPNARRYGGFLEEWSAIYDRFAVPAELGLAQAVIESGLNGAVRSEARAVGFCQWLLPNWRRLQRLAPHVIEANNQTTQASYCAAYLTVLATRYGTFIAALSDHHAGGTNVGRTLINGERLGGTDVREQYFLGSEFARDVRLLAPSRYKDAYGTYGPRSFRYAEMVFGSTFNVAQMTSTLPQVRIHAMRTSRAIPLAEVRRVTGLSTDAVRRFNPALIRSVPARATLYLPRYVKQFGADVSFWRRPAGAAYISVLNDFVRLDVPSDAWDTPAFATTLGAFRRRFQQTKSEEGAVMATVLAYVIDDIRTSGRGVLLDEFRTSPGIRAVFEQAVRERVLAQENHALRTGGAADE